MTLQNWFVIWLFRNCLNLMPKNLYTHTHTQLFLLFCVTHNPDLAPDPISYSGSNLTLILIQTPKNVWTCKMSPKSHDPTSTSTPRTHTHTHTLAPSPVEDFTPACIIIFSVPFLFFLPLCLCFLHTFLINCLPLPPVGCTLLQQWAEWMMYFHINWLVSHSNLLFLSVFALSENNKSMGSTQEGRSRNQSGLDVVVREASTWSFVLSRYRRRGEECLWTVTQREKRKD